VKIAEEQVLHDRLRLIGIARMGWATPITFVVATQVLLLSALPMSASAQVLVPHAVVATSPLPIDGTWVLKQVATASDLTPDLVTALAAPKIRGFSMRVPWSSIATDLTMNTLLDLGRAQADAANIAFSVRFIAGSESPPAVLAGPNYMAAPIGGGALVKVAAPFTSSGGPNTTFEVAYEAEVSRLAVYCHAHGIHLLHLPWYGVNYAELNMGHEVQALSGFTYQNWLDAHKRLVDIAFRYRTPDLAIEYPLSGYGPLTGSGSLTIGNAVDDLSNYIVLKSGGDTNNVFIQANGLGPQAWGIGDWGTTSSTAETAMDAASWHKTIGHGEQMIDADDYNWGQVFWNLRVNGARYVEIYWYSFRAGLAHHDGLLLSIADFGVARVPARPRSPGTSPPARSAVSTVGPTAIPGPRVPLTTSAVGSGSRTPEARLTSPPSNPIFRIYPTAHFHVVHVWRF